MAREATYDLLRRRTLESPRSATNSVHSEPYLNTGGFGIDWTTTERQFGTRIADRTLRAARSAALVRSGLLPKRWRMTGSGRQLPREEGYREQPHRPQPRIAASRQAAHFMSFCVADQATAECPLLASAAVQPIILERQESPKPHPGRFCFLANREVCAKRRVATASRSNWF